MIVSDIIDSALKNGEMVFDVEHDPNVSLMSPSFSLWGISFKTLDQHAYIEDAIDCKKIIQETCSTDTLIINHNIKYDLKCITKLGWIPDYPKNIADTMTAVNLLFETRRENQLGLKVVVKDFYNYQMKLFKEVSKLSHTSQEFKNYALEDSFYTYKLWQDLKPKLKEQEQEKLFFKILMESKKTFGDLELVGIKWDVAKAKELITLYNKKEDELKIEIQKNIGSDINLNSPAQLSNRLFIDLKWDSKNIPMTDGGERAKPRLKVDEEALEILSKKYPTAKTIIDYKKCRKIIGTYLEPLSNLAISTYDQRLRTNFWLESTTGRTRSNDPINLQNIIVIDDPNLNIKQCFIADNEFEFGVADLSQIELRFGAKISGDTNLSNAYLNWKCGSCATEGQSQVILHECPNCKIKEDKRTLKGFPGFYHGIDLHQQICENVKALKNNRDLGKTCNFAVIYNATAWTLYNRNPSASVKEWQKVIDEYFTYHKGIYMWHRRTEILMQTKKEIKDLFGRKIRLQPQDLSFNMLKRTLNRCINFPVQSSATLYTLYCVNKIREKMIEKGWWKTLFFLVNHVHDEVDFEYHLSIKDEVLKIIRDCLELGLNIGMPIRVEIGTGPNWYSAKGG